jgi:superfamily II DNA or RNA helicase
MLLKPDPHQIETVKYMLKNPYSIAALDMGLGKSFCALLVWRKLRGNCLIICPAYLVMNWHAEIKKCLGEEPIVTIIRKGKDIYEIFDSDFVIISYDLAQKSEQLFEWADMVILDEGQELKSMKAKRTEYLHRVIYENSIKRLHILTGTPIKNRVEEYYSLMALMNYDPRNKKSTFLERFPDSITFADHFSFRREFTMDINGKWVTVVKWEGVRPERIAELKGNLKEHYIRFTADKVLKLDLPRVIEVLVSDTEDKKLLQSFTNYYESGDNDSVAPTAKAEAALRTVPFTIQYTKKLLEEIECVPIYTDHVESAKALAAAFGVEPITGAMNPAKRVKMGQAFQRGEMPVLVATIKSFSTGVSLTRARDLVENDPSWVPGDQKQVIYRIHRRDQKHPCRIHRMLGSPQAKYIYDALAVKTETINLVT